MRLLGLLTLCLFGMTGIKFGHESRQEIASFVSDRINALGPTQVASNDAEAVVQPSQTVPVVQPSQAAFAVQPSETAPTVQPSQAAPTVQPSQAAETTQAVVAMREAGAYTALIGLPSFTRVHFDLPQSASAVSGEVVLNVSRSLARNTDAVLRVSVNGTRRSAQLLDRGPMERTLVLPLTVRDLSAETVVVTLSTEDAVTRSTGGAVVEILPSSHVTLQLNAPVTDPLDKLLLAGVPARFAWPELNAADQAIVLASAFDVTQRQTDVLFNSQADNRLGLSTDEIKQLAAQLPARAVADQIDRADLATALGQRRIQDFSSSATWRMPFDAHTLSGQPEAVQLNLKFATAQTRKTPWLMAVFINDRFLTGRLVQGSEGQLQTQVTLPAAFLARQNVLTVTFRNRSSTSDVPDNGPPSVAELRTAQLLLTNASTPTPKTDLAGLLGNGANLNVPNALTVFQGQVALDTLKTLASVSSGLMLMPEGAQNVARADITVIKKDHLDAFLDAIEINEGEQIWLAYQSGDAAQTLVTQALSATSTIVTDALPKSVLIISGVRQVENS